MDRLKSRKFWGTTIASLLVVLISAVFDIPNEEAEQAVDGIVKLWASYNVAQGFADGQAPKKETPDE